MLMLINTSSGMNLLINASSGMNLANGVRLLSSSRMTPPNGVRVPSSSRMNLSGGEFQIHDVGVFHRTLDYGLSRVFEGGGGIFTLFHFHFLNKIILRFILVIFSHLLQLQLDTVLIWITGCYQFDALEKVGIWSSCYFTFFLLVINNLSYIFFL